MTTLGRRDFVIGSSGFLVASIEPAKAGTHMDNQADILERFQLHELIGRYVDALNHRDWVRYKDCWIEDSSFAMTIANDDAPIHDKLTSIKKPTGVAVVGREQILNMVGTYNNYPWLFQIPTGIAVELNGPGKAQIRHTLHVYSQSLKLIGICYDRAIKEKDGKWRLTRRDYRPSYWEYAEAPGLTCRKLPDPNYLNLP